MIKYKIDILESLKSAGYTTYRLKKEKLIADSVIQYIRDGKLCGMTTLDTVCRLLHCQPGDILTYTDTDE